MGKYSKPNSNKNTVTQETAFQQFVTFFMEIMISLYVFIMLVVYPLFYHNKYFNMGSAKFVFFEAVSLVFLGALVVGTILWICANFENQSFKMIFAKFNVTDWFAIVYLFVCYFSFLLSDDKHMAFFGFDGWNMGFLSQLIFVLIYFYVSRCWKWSPTTIIAGMMSAIIAYFLCVIMRFGFDPLAMYENLSLVDIEKFVSTLGQTTWYSSYAVLLFPVGIYYYMFDDKTWVKYFSVAFIALATMSLCTVNSDSGYIAYILIMMVFFWFSMESNERFTKYLDVATIMLVSCRIIGILQMSFPERMVKLVAGEEEKISKFVTQSTAMIVLTVIVIILNTVFHILLIKDEDKKEPTFDIKKLKVLRWIMLVLAISVLLAVFVAIILVTTKSVPEPLNKLYGVDFFNFTNAWGNHRGFNWRAAWTAFKSSSVKDLFVGVGPDCFDLAMSKYCAEEVRVYWQGLHLACAHNEFLNILVTEGILGIVSYLGIMLTSAYRCAKAANQEPAAMFVVAIIYAYIGHNFFCYQQCICTPILFIFIGMGEVIIRESKR